MLGFLLSLLLLNSYADTRIDGISYPEPLRKNSGGLVTSVQDWEDVRRQELLTLFRENVYGYGLPQPAELSIRVQTRDYSAVRRKIVSIGVQGRYGTKTFQLR